MTLSNIYNTTVGIEPDDEKHGEEIGKQMFFYYKKLSNISYQIPQRKAFLLSDSQITSLIKEIDPDLNKSIPDIEKNMRNESQMMRLYPKIPKYANTLFLIYYRLRIDNTKPNLLSMPLTKEELRIIEK